MWIKHPLGKIAVYVPEPKQIVHAPVIDAEETDAPKKAKAKKTASK